MNQIIREPDGYSFEAALERAKQQAAYWEEDLRLAIADRVVRELEEQKISRSELARRMGVSAPYITKMLGGHANLTLKSLAKMAFVLDLKWECLLLSKEASLGPYVLHDGEGAMTIHTVEMATIGGWGHVSGAGHASEYGQERPLGEKYELSFSA